VIFFFKLFVRGLRASERDARWTTAYTIHPPPINRFLPGAAAFALPAFASAGV
jgi:hypothetical protein